MSGVFAFIVTGEQWSELLEGLVVSLKVSLASLAVGLPLAVVLAVMVLSPRRAVSVLGLVIVEIGRGTPALVLLLLVYYGLPQQGLTLTSFVSGVAALGFSTAAYGSEVFRTSIRAVPGGQREAAASLGLRSFDTFRTIVLPQALRIAVPQLVGLSILVFQGSALCFAIALPELLSQAYQIGSFTFHYLDALIAASIIYAVIAIPLSQLSGLLERRLSRRL
jgi:polar amino acid transport system permease protein